MVDMQISPAEEEGRNLLESKILLHLPDIEMLWRYHPMRKEHSCCFSKGAKSRTVFFSCEMLKNISTKPASMEDMAKETVAELKRRLS